MFLRSIERVASSFISFASSASGARALVDSHFTLEHGRRAFVGGRGDWRKHLNSNGAFVTL